MSSAVYFALVYYCCCYILQSTDKEVNLPIIPYDLAAITFINRSCPWLAVLDAQTPLVQFAWISRYKMTISTNGERAHMRPTKMLSIDTTTICDDTPDGFAPVLDPEAVEPADAEEPAVANEPAVVDGVSLCEVAGEPPLVGVPDAAA